ncbi:hypothetical protein FRB99_006109 [Tulasnella sp. 403]|nr:hypothetical protein FRB99_006109 [Tulasnella sp. 403]
MGASSSLLITGILGIKAYRCLNRSKFVLLVTAALQIASLVFFFFDLMRTSSTRAFNGTCTMNTNTATFIPACVSVMFSETGFLSLCFLVAVWRSSKSPAAQGRLSLVLSEDNGTGTSPSLEPPGLNHGRRGWWDYVPDAEPQPTNPNQLPPIQRLRSHESGTSVLLARPMPASATWYGRLQHSLEVALVRSGLPDARETSSTSGLEKGLGRRPHTNTTFNSGIQAAVKLAAPKELDERRWSRRLPNVLRAVIRNEVCTHLNQMP